MRAVRKQTLTAALPAAIYWQKRHQHMRAVIGSASALVADRAAQASPAIIAAFPISRRNVASIMARSVAAGESELERRTEVQLTIRCSRRGFRSRTALARHVSPAMSSRIGQSGRSSPWQAWISFCSVARIDCSSRTFSSIAVTWLLAISRTSWLARLLSR